MSYAVLDCETTIRNKGNPFTKGNKLCLVGIYTDKGYMDFDIEFTSSPYGPQLEEIKSILESVDFVIGFNVKFDLHWIKNYVPDLSIRCVFDTQLGDFLLGYQRGPYPSLDDSCARFGLGSKSTVVESEYWQHGIDTTEIPGDILRDYLRRDVELTNDLFLAQQRVLTPEQKKLLFLQGKDLLVLLEMERNGLVYDKERAALLGKKAQERMLEIDQELRSLAGSDLVNFGSDDHISALLYGGVIFEQYRFQYERILIDGSVSKRERWEERPHDFPRIVSPLKGTETKPTNGWDDAQLHEENRVRRKEGKKLFTRKWSVAEPVLRRLKLNKRARLIVDLMLERSNLKKLDSTYYTGLVEKMDEMDSYDGLIHGQFNQVVAVTGRLSSSNPNLQNFSGEIKELFRSRYVD